MDFTREQSQAIFTRDQDILVSAGAGAGKTRVLVTRISEMILDKNRPISADQILVLTFTKAAAREMKERITKELSERLAMNPEDRYLRQQIRVVKHADISNVHSFCNHLLRNYFNELGIDPAFRVGEEGELKTMKEQAMEFLLEDSYQEEKESFVQLVEAYAPEKNDHEIENMIERLYKFSKNFPDSATWFKEMEQQFKDLCEEDTMNDALALRALLDRSKEKVSDLCTRMEHARGYFGEDCEPVKYYEFHVKEENMLRDLMEAPDFISFYDKIQAISFAKYPSTRVDKNIFPYKELVKGVRDEVKKQIEKMQKSYFMKSLAQIRIDQRKLLPMFQELISLTMRYDEIYSGMKREKNVFDFNDLEHLTLQLLVDHYEDGEAVPTEKAKEIAARYKAIFVDEYQDTNLVQETIITVLQKSGSCELFTVGDIKQSIYGFRQARPDLFLNRYHRYEKGDGLKIELRDNFRSSPDVLDFCNSFFRRFMTEDFGGIDYDGDVELKAGENGPNYDVHASQEALFLLEEMESETDDDEENLDALTAEAAMISKRIEELHEEGYDYEDMVILLRSIQNKGSVIAEYLESQKIPAIAESETGYFQTREIRVIRNYLSIIDNVYQDIPMASALMSKIGGFTAQDLGKLKTLVDGSVRKQFYLYDLMRLYMEEGTDESLRLRVRAFMDQLDEFRQKKQEMLLHELIWDIFETTGFFEIVLSMPHGEKRKRNLMMLVQEAEKYEKTMFKGLFYFVRYLEKLYTYEVKMGNISADDSAENAVKIMTIHKSKGLEFPVVFVSNLSKQFNLKDLNEKVLCHPVLGIGMEKVDLDDRTRSPSILKSAIREQLLKEIKEEELRLLYVAMTRAQKKLVLTSVVSPKKKEKIENGDNRYSAEQAKCLLDWVLPVLYEEGNWNFTRFVAYEEVRSWMKDDSDLEHLSLQMILEDPRVQNAPAEKVRQSFSKTYPFAESIQWKRKYSVSELKKLSMQKLPEEEIPVWEVPDLEEEVPKPAFLRETAAEEEETIRGTDYGTMVHKVMELLPFAKISSKKELFDVMDDLWKQFPQVPEATRKKVYRGLENFLFSSYGEVFAQMDREGKLYKELPFTIGLDSALVYPGTAGGETVILQGIIDVCGEKEGELWLLDYKTDRIKEGEESLLLDRYKAQMLYYKLALEQMLEKKVSHSVIYSFALQKYIDITW